MGKVLDFHGHEVLGSGRVEGAWGDAGTFDFGYKSYMAMVDGGAEVDVWYRAHWDDPETPQPFKDGMDAARADLAGGGIMDRFELVERSSGGGRRRRRQRCSCIR